MPMTAKQRKERSQKAAAARSAAARRRRLERHAAELRDAGYRVEPPTDEKPTCPCVASYS